MLGLDDIQGSLVQYLKTITDVTNKVSPSEIKEQFWQGEDFVYPCIRVSCSLTPDQNGCGPDTVSGRIIVFSEQKSSKESITISGIVAKKLHRNSFTYNNVHWILITILSLPEPVFEDGIWQSEIQFMAKVQTK